MCRDITGSTTGEFQPIKLVFEHMLANSFVLIPVRYLENVELQTFLGSRMFGRIIYDEGNLRMLQRQKYCQNIASLKSAYRWFQSTFAIPTNTVYDLLHISEFLSVESRFSEMKDIVIAASKFMWCHSLKDVKIDICTTPSKLDVVYVPVKLLPVDDLYLRTATGLSAIDCKMLCQMRYFASGYTTEQFTDSDVMLTVAVTDAFRTKCEASQIILIDTIRDCVFKCALQLCQPAFWHSPSSENCIHFNRFLSSLTPFIPSVLANENLFLLTLDSKFAEIVGCVSALCTFTHIRLRTPFSTFRQLWRQKILAVERMSSIKQDIQYAINQSLRWCNMLPVHERPRVDLAAESSLATFMTACASNSELSLAASLWHALGSIVVELMQFKDSTIAGDQNNVSTKLRNIKAFALQTYCYLRTTIENELAVTLTVEVKEQDSMIMIWDKVAELRLSMLSRLVSEFDTKRNHKELCLMHHLQAVFPQSEELKQFKACHQDITIDTTKFQTCGDEISLCRQTVKLTNQKYENVYAAYMSLLLLDSAVKKCCHVYDVSPPPQNVDILHEVETFQREHFKNASASALPITHFYDQVHKIEECWKQFKIIERNKIANIKTLSAGTSEQECIDARFAKLRLLTVNALLLL